MRTAVLVTLLGCSSACATEPDDQHPSEIVNGDPIPATQLPFVGMVRSVTAEGVGLCSGSLLSDRVVLTAAHCIPDDGNVTGVQFTTAAAYTGAQWTQVVDVRRQFYWPGHFVSLTRGDLALLKLATPLPQPVYPALLADPTQLSTELGSGAFSETTIVGYGLDSSAGGAGIKRVGLVSFYAWMSTAGALGTAPDNFQLLLNLPSKLEQACPGDSGGPALVQSAAGPILTGVAHGGTSNDGICGPNNSAAYTAIAPYRAWILAKAAELSGVFGDLDHDGRVTTTDLDRFGVALRTNTYDPVYDIDNDGDVDLRDADRMVFDRVKILYGDIDGDGDADGGDFLLWQRLLGKTTGKWTDGDMNFDGKTDALDKDVWQRNFGKRATNVESSLVEQ